jgi:hypothetical protein
VDWDDFEYEPDEEREEDSYTVSARDTLELFFDQHRENVFFSNQLAVQNEREYFHWVTSRAVDDLVGLGAIMTETRPLAGGSSIKLLWHRSHRYYKRDAKRLITLVEEYGSPNMRAAIGLHGETMVLEGFARREFVMRGRHAREFNGKKWTNSQHNLDFIFERDGQAYGVEVKNTLSYMDQAELNTKLAMCEHLQIKPVFAVRMLPKNWINDVIAAGGYAMIMRYQLYPWTHADLARRVARELDLPVDAPRALADGTMDRFLKWHTKNL